MKNFLLLCFSILFTIVLVECVLQLLNKPSSKVEVRVGWNSIDINPFINPVNQMGFRGKKIVSTNNFNTILFLGDSQVESAGLPESYMLENLFIEKLSILDTLNDYDSFTIGAGGFGQDQQLLALREYFSKFSAKYVYLWVTPENDIWNNIFPSHWPTNGNPKPTFRISNDSLIGPNYNFRQLYYVPSDLKLYQLFKRFFNPFEYLDSKWESFFPKPYLGLSYDSLKHRKIEGVGYYENLEIEKSHYSIYFSPRSERFQYGIELTRKLLKEIDLLCKENDATLRIFLVENQYLQSRVKESDYFYLKDGLVYKANVNQYFENINSLYGDFEFDFIKLDTDWKQISLQDAHFNHIAQDEIASKLAEIFIQRDISK